jgi:hypothetical protein
MKYLLKFSLLLIIGLIVSSCSKDKDKGKGDAKEGIVINGVRWATCNVDAPGTFVANSEEVGMFYQWNRKVGWSSTDPMINSDGGTKWDNSYPSGETWEPENDPCPSGWRVPTMKELESLEKAKSYWGELNGIPGRFFGDKSNPFFLPAASFRDYVSGTLSSVNGEGCYWGNNLNYQYNASRLGFTSTYIGVGYVKRVQGECIRCVADKKYFGTFDT